MVYRLTRTQPEAAHFEGRPPTGKGSRIR